MFGLNSEYILLLNNFILRHPSDEQLTFFVHYIIYDYPALTIGPLGIHEVSITNVVICKISPNNTSQLVLGVGGRG